MPGARDESFSRENRLRKSNEFRRIFSRGKRVSTRYFVIYSLPNRLTHSRIGIQVKAKIGSAVRRNYIKRMVRETFRKMKHEFRSPVDLILIAEKQILDLTCSTFEQEFRKVLIQNLRWTRVPLHTLFCYCCGFIKNSFRRSCRRFAGLHQPVLNILLKLLSDTARWEEFFWGWNESLDAIPFVKADLIPYGNLWIEN